MQQITITVEDDGRTSVASDGAEPEQFETAQEALTAVQAMLMPGAGEPGMASQGPGDAAAMWDAEAAARPEQRNLMA